MTTPEATDRFLCQSCGRPMLGTGGGLKCQWLDCKSKSPEATDGLRERLRQQATKDAVFFTGSSGLLSAREKLMLEAADTIAAKDAELATGQHAYRVADAWRQGARDAGHAQPMEPARRDIGKVAAPYVAAYEMGYAFIHNSPVAMEMAGRIQRVAERASKDEAELAILKAQRLGPNTPDLQHLTNTIIHEQAEAIATLKAERDADAAVAESNLRLALKERNAALTERDELKAQADAVKAMQQYTLQQLEAAEAQLTRYREALKHLRQEIAGIIGYAENDLRQLIGNTNLAVLKQRVNEADAALADAPPSPTERQD